MITERLRSVAREVETLATAHLWAYYRFMVEAIGPGGTGLPEIRAVEEVWEHVELPRVPVVSIGATPLAPSPCYVVFEGEVSSEGEYGLQLVFDHSGTSSASTSTTGI